MVSEINVDAAVVRVKITYSVDALIAGSDLDGVDEAATVAAYEAAVAAEVAATYPDAEVSVTGDDAGYSRVRVTFDPDLGHANNMAPAEWIANHDAEEACYAAMERVWEVGQFWTLEGEA